jgi:PAS domain-containing protein
MSGLVIAADSVAMLAFFAAALVAAFSHFESPVITPAVRWPLVAAMSLYGLVGISNALEHAHITSYFDVYEDYAELLFIPALAFMGNAMMQNWQLEKATQSARATRQQNDLLLNVVDTVPGGVLVVDPTGAVVFANEGAERILGMHSDSLGSLRVTPSWRLSDPLTGRPVTLAQIASGGKLVRVPLRATWPDGNSVNLLFSATPMNVQDGALGGSVVGFESDPGTE